MKRARLVATMMMLLMGLLFAGNAKAEPNSSARLVFSSDRGGNRDLYTMDLSGDNLKNITNTPGADEEPAVWSVDGKYIAYMRKDLSNSDYSLYIYSVQDETTRKVNLQFPYPSTLRWSPDGKLSVFSGFGQEGDDAIMNVKIIDPLDDSIIKDVSGLFVGTGEISFSPDGKYLALSIEKAELNDIYQIHKIGIYDSSDEPLTEGTGSVNGELSPAWSPDGSAISYVQTGQVDTNISEAIYAMDVDGSNKRKIVDFPYLPSLIASSNWRPDGQRVVYAGSTVNPWVWHLYNISPASNEIEQLSNLSFEVDYNESFEYIIDPFIGETISGNWVDQRYYAASSPQTGNSEVYVIDTDTSQFVNISNNSASDVLSLQPVGNPLTTQETPELTPSSPKTGKVVGALIATAALFSIAIIIGLEIKKKHHGA